VNFENHLANACKDIQEIPELAKFTDLIIDDKVVSPIKVHAMVRSKSEDHICCGPKMTGFEDAE
jgi:hypothetical protein